MARSDGLIHAWRPAALSIARIFIALLFIEHGTQKMFNIPPSEQGPMPFNLFSMMGIAGIIELVGGLLLLIGLGTRVVAFILAGEMAIAYWTVHAPNGAFPLMNKGELAALYCFAFLVFTFTGGGSWSVDRLLQHRNEHLAEPTQVAEESPSRRASLM